LYVVALVSFLLGSFGYVFVRFVLIPIGRYRRLKSQIAKQIAGFDPADRSKIEPDTGVSKKIRQLSAALSDCHSEQLPHWYRLYLEGRRNEFPLDAAKTLMALSSTRQSDQAAAQMEKIRQALNLKP